MGLKGSKTEQNLKDAFAGESQANRRYLYFANKADVEGQNDVAIARQVERARLQAGQHVVAYVIVRESPDTRIEHGLVHEFMASQHTGPSHTRKTFLRSSSESME